MFQTKEQSQDKASNKVDKELNKKSKQKSLEEETWGDICCRGASLKEQLDWINIRKKQKEKQWVNKMI